MSKTTSNRDQDSSRLPVIVDCPEPSEPPGLPGFIPDRQFKLSTPQEQALEWLIGGGSLGEAAQFAGVSRQTLSRWMRTDDDFRSVYEAWKLECSQMLEGRLIAAGEEAMDNLLNAVRVTQDVKASQFVIKALLEIKKKSAG